jgi:hypothetical protein
MPLLSNWKEDAVRRALLENLIRLRIVERHVVDVELDAGGPLDLVDRVEDERERAQSQEVHLQEADALDLLHRPLRRDFVSRSLVERRIVGDCRRCNDDAGGMDGRMPRHALQSSGDRKQFLHPGIVLLEILERLALLERLVERHVQGRRNLLRHLVHVGERHLQHAPDVAHDCLRLHRSEGDDLRDVLAAVLSRDVLDDLAAPALAEIDVDIGQ